jgi:hypothetical protein
MTFSQYEQQKILEVKSTVKSLISPFMKKLLGNVDSVGNISKMFVSGGVFASLLQGEKPNDIDVYFTEEDAMNKLTNIIKKNHWDYIKSVSENYREYIGIDGKLITENAITLIDDVQLITKTYGTPEEIRKTFDFVHCTPYYSLADDKLYISRQQYDAIIKYELINVSPIAPVPRRVDKFVKRGYTYNPQKSILQAS